MPVSIGDILEEIDSLNADLRKEYDRLATKYGFSFQKHKVIFLEKFRKRNCTFRLPSWKYIIPTNVRHFLSIQFIYGMIIPTVIFDIFLLVYQWVGLLPLSNPNGR